nr:uncharacterized protein LOC123569366 [Macaca fascicularis]
MEYYKVLRMYELQLHKRSLPILCVIGAYASRGNLGRPLKPAAFPSLASGGRCRAREPVDQELVLPSWRHVRSRAEVFRRRTGKSLKTERWQFWRPRSGTDPRPQCPRGRPDLGDGLRAPEVKSIGAEVGP